MIQPSGSVETHWNRFDDMSELYSQTEDAYLPMKYIGNTEYNLMIMKNSGLGEQSRFVVNDADYERLRADLPENKIGVQVLFDNVESVDPDVPAKEQDWWYTSVLQQMAFEKTDCKSICAADNTGYRSYNYLYSNYFVYE